MNDADELIASALAENECGFVVYDHHDTNIGPASHHTYDAWTEAPVEDSGFTTFEDTGASFEDWMIGWLLVPDVHQLAYLEIVDVDDTAGTVTVKGNAENMAADGTQYWLVAPTGVSATHGAIETDPEKTPTPGYGPTTTTARRWQASRPPGQAPECTANNPAATWRAPTTAGTECMNLRQADGPRRTRP